MQSNLIPSNDKLLIAYSVVTRVTMAIVVTSVAFNENVNEDLRFSSFGTHDENQDDGEVNSQER